MKLIVTGIKSYDDFLSIYDGVFSFTPEEMLAHYPISIRIDGDNKFWDVDKYYEDKYVGYQRITCDEYLEDRFKLMVLKSSLEHWLRIYEILQMPRPVDNPLNRQDNAAMYYTMLDNYGEWPYSDNCNCCLYLKKNDECEVLCPLGDCMPYYSKFTVSKNRIEYLRNSWSMIIFINEVVQKYENVVGVV